VIKIDVLASGSSGNAYIVSNGASNILLDCGIPLKQINILSGWKKIDACFVSHEHKDHCKAVKDIIKLGVPVYMPNGMKVDLTVAQHNITGLQDGSKVLRQHWYIKAFGLHHDVHTLGYSITDRSTENKIVYITDTMYCSYRFKDATHWMIECNNDEESLNQSVADGTLHPTLRNRIVKNHMSLATVKELLLANDLSLTQEIWLLHLSKTNSDAEKIRREVQEVTGKAVYIA